MGKKKSIALDSKYYTENEVNAFIDQLEIIDAKKADVDTTFSKTEVNKLISDALSVNTPVVKLDTLPTTGEENTFYLIPESNKTTNNNYNIYLWINNAWEQIDAVNFDLSAYATKEELDTNVRSMNDYINSSIQNTNNDVEARYQSLLAQMQDMLTSLSNEDTSNTDRISTLESWQTAAMNGDTSLLLQSLANDLYYQKTSIDSMLTGVQDQCNGQFSAAMGAVGAKANISDVYTKSEIDQQLGNINTALDKLLGV